uniref:Uncharacterized protein n=1 Tax=Caenorhabditis japonica TaxID=281687 RepID=A0A8R1J228_CAEJA
MKRAAPRRLLSVGRSTFSFSRPETDGCFLLFDSNRYSTARWKREKEKETAFRGCADHNTIERPLGAVETISRPCFHLLLLRLLCLPRPKTSG